MRHLLTVSLVGVLIFGLGVMAGMALEAAKHVPLSIFPPDAIAGAPRV